MKKRSEIFVQSLFFLAAIVSILALLLICIFLFKNGLPAIKKIGFLNFIAGTSWKPNDIPPLFGIFPMIIGSLYITSGALLVGVPLGILSAIYLAYYCNKKRYSILKSGIDLLAGIPSVVYGFFGITVLVPIVKYISRIYHLGGNGFNIVTASLLLGIMILPTILSITLTSLKALPNTYYEASLALGATKERTIFKVCLHAAKSGVVSSIILGLGRAIGETMAVVMIAGNQAWIPDSIFKGVRTLTANIIIEMGYATDLHREALIATGVVLFIFTLLINLCFSLINRKD